MGTWYTWGVAFLAFAFLGNQAFADSEGSTAFDPAFTYGVNISAGNGTPDQLPGHLGGEVPLTPESHFAYYASKGITSVRIQGSWERLQPKLNGPLDGELLTYGGRADPMANMVAFTKYHLDMAHKYKLKAYLDLAHNYGRRYVGFDGTWNQKRKVELGSEELPIAAFVDFNVKVVQAFGNHPAVIGIELMNEPHDLAIGSAGWQDSVQQSIDAIRKVNDSIVILVDGYGWASSVMWEQNNPNLEKLVDPSNRILFSAHCYFDNSGAGIYADAEREKPTHTDYNLGADRLQPFINWLAKHNLQGRGHVGEFGVPNTPAWAEVARRFMIAARSAGLMLTPHQDIPYPDDPYIMNLYPAKGQSDRYVILFMESLKQETGYVKTPLVP